MPRSPAHRSPEDALIEHDRRTPRVLLSRLEHEDDIPRFVAPRVEQANRADQARHVKVVSHACMTPDRTDA